MSIILISLLAKLVASISKIFNLGAGVTWPGEIALRLDSKLPHKLARQLKKGIIIVAGTNGKTTTASLISHILTQNHFKVIHNTTGANLLNGITGSLLSKTDLWGKLSADYAVMEVDEASLPEVLTHLSPRLIILLNLFRDQLDRYGEVDTIATNWQTAINTLNKNDTALIANGDDPLIAYIGASFKGHTDFFGINGSQHDLKTLPHAADSIYCHWCGHKLIFKSVYLAHYGDWHCPSCSRARPPVFYTPQVSTLEGVHNIYNQNAALLATKKLGLAQDAIISSIKTFTPSFGRQEEFRIKDKIIKIYLSKNPAGFNESIRTVLKRKDTQAILLALNDRIPDGTDVSWIWDVDLEILVNKFKNIIITGDRAYDMALRLKYALPDKEDFSNKGWLITQDSHKALHQGLEQINPHDTLCVLPTYSAMLDIRKIITGKKIP